MRTLLNLLMLLLVGNVALAQTGKTTLTGTVKNAEGKPLEGATVSLIQVPQNKVLKTGATNVAGVFSFINIGEGTYQVTVSAVGYGAVAPVVVKVTAGQETVTIAVAPLQVATKALGDVVVQGKMKMVEVKADKTVVNVDAMISNAGSSALDILEKSPGVLVDKDGNISLKGKQGVIIMLDGKPSYLGGQDLANYLRSLPSNQLDQLEIMTQPSAKYDASGNSGIINIRTKKSKMNGFNGNVSTSYIQGIYPKSNNSVGFNWRKNKVNLFGTYSHSYWTGLNTINLYRVFPNSYFDQHSIGKRFSRSSNLKLGMDYNLNKTTTLGVVFTGTYDPRLNNTTGFTNILNAGKGLDSINQSLAEDHSIWKNGGVNLNFRKLLNNKGRELAADVDVITYRNNSNQRNVNTMLLSSGQALRNPFLLNGQLPSIISIYSFKADYTHPLTKESKLEAGIKISQVNTNNNAIYKTYDYAGKTWIDDTTRSNHFLYNENINAVYVNYNRQMKKWGVQAGLRLENTNGKGNQVVKQSAFTRHYTQLFPTLYISHTLNDKNTFTLNYGRRINRPNYQDLNPFINFLDQYTYNQGNPYLLPQFSHNIELSHNYKGTLNTTLNFSTTNNIINDILVQNDTTKVTYQTKKNIARQENFGLAISYNAPLTKWYSISLYGNGFINHFSGVVNNRNLNVSVPSAMFNVNNQFKFNKGWAAEASGWFRTRTQESGIYLVSPMGGMNLAVSKQVLQNKGTLKLGVNDVLYTQKFHLNTKFGNINTNISGRNDSRRVSLTFSYRFGKNMQQQTRRRASSAQDEQNRVGGGGNG